MLKRAGRQKMTVLKKVYDLSTARALEMAQRLAEQADIIADANGEIEKRGVTVEAGKNGAPYMNPAVGVRNKAVELAMDIEDRLAKLFPIGGLPAGKGGRKSGMGLKIDDDD